MYMVELHEAEKPIFAIIDTVCQCPVSSLDWLPNFPHKAWVDPGEGSFTCQVNRREWESNCDSLCSNRSPWPLYHSALSTILSYSVDKLFNNCIMFSIFFIIFSWIFSNNFYKNKTILKQKATSWHIFIIFGLAFEMTLSNKTFAF